MDTEASQEVLIYVMWLIQRVWQVWAIRSGDTWSNIELSKCPTKSSTIIYVLLTLSYKAVASKISIMNFLHMWLHSCTYLIILIKLSKFDGGYTPLCIWSHTFLICWQTYSGFRDLSNHSWKVLGFIDKHRNVVKNEAHARLCTLCVGELIMTNPFFSCHFGSSIKILFCISCYNFFLL